MYKSHFLQKIALVILLALTATVVAQATEGSNDILVAVNGVLIDFDDASPALIDGRVLVPARAVFAALGYEVYWDNNAQMVTLVGVYTIRLWVGASHMEVLGHGTIALDVPAQLVGGRTMIPARVVADAIGADVDWLPSLQKVTIDMPARDYGNATFNDLLGFGYSFEQAQDIFEQEIFVLFNEWRLANGREIFVQDASFAGTNRTWARYAAGRRSDLDAGIITLAQFDQRVMRSFGDAVRAGTLGTGYPWRLGTLNDPVHWPIDGALTPQTAADMRLH